MHKTYVVTGGSSGLGRAIIREIMSTADGRSPAMVFNLSKRYGITVFGISPAKIAGTGMSRYIEEKVPELRGWTPEEAREYQLKGLVTGCEIPAAIIAEFIVWLLADKSRHLWLSGCVVPYGA
jgi:NAD(P)-dependent dehydrogenase (short-subunit alcohol dehydrogenase family)